VIIRLPVARPYIGCCLACLVIARIVVASAGVRRE
jgi:hypothetical protein